MIKKNKITAAMILLGLTGGILTGTGGCIVKGAAETEPLKVTLLKVGKADAIAIQTEKNTMVIDTGEEEDGEELVFYLKNQGITQVDTLLITHFDQDHVGGADTLIESMDVERVLVPDYEGTSTEYQDFMIALEEKGMTAERLKKAEEFELGSAKVLVEPPASCEIKNGEAEVDNNFSIITTVTHGKNRLLFTGDAEKQRIRQWMKEGNVSPCDFLKVPHHGVYNTALQELFETVAPEYAVICSSNKNPADPQTIELLKKYNTHVFQTKDGNITVISDGTSLEMKQDLEH